MSEGFWFVCDAEMKNFTDWTFNVDKTLQKYLELMFYSYFKYLLKVTEVRVGVFLWDKVFH